MDFGILAEVFVVTVVGGMGSILGAFLAAVLISELNTFGILVWPPGTLVLMFILMAVILVVRPTALPGHPEAAGHKAEARPEERRVGKAGVSTRSTRWSPFHQNNKKQIK